MVCGSSAEGAASVALIGLETAGAGSVVSAGAELGASSLTADVEAVISSTVGATGESCAVCLSAVLQSCMR